MRGGRSRCRLGTRLPAEVRRRAAFEVPMPTPIRTLIVDDEPLARRGLALRLGEHADIELVGQCSNGADAVRAVAELGPALLFLDVQMPELDGFDTLRAIPPGQRPLVVFVTAYDQHAVQAFEAHALDYLLKPLDSERLAQSLDRVRDSLAERGAADQQDRLLQLLRELSGRPGLSLDDALDLQPGSDARSREVLTVRDGSRRVRVPIASIRWIEAAGDYMCVQTDSETHVVRATLRELETQLDGSRFQRVHRSTIVNIDRVRAMRSHINGEYFLELDCGRELKLSRSYRDKVQLLR
jgi:two-component system, LytTR family, response regulator